MTPICFVDMSTAPQHYHGDFMDCNGHVFRICILGKMLICKCSYEESGLWSFYYSSDAPTDPDIPVISFQEWEEIYEQAVTGGRAEPEAGDAGQTELEEEVSEVQGWLDFGEESVGSESEREADVQMLQSQLHRGGSTESIVDAELPGFLGAGSPSELHLYDTLSVGSFPADEIAGVGG